MTKKVKITIGFNNPPLGDRGIIATFNKHRKLIASFLFVLFYLELCLPIYANNHRWEEVRTNPRPLLRQAQNWGSREALDFSSFRYKLNTSENAILKKPIISNSTIINQANRSKFPFRGQGSKHPFRGRGFLGGGPGQPETQSFQSVGSGNMVDLFSGDFSYNIPLLDVGGYPVNIHYRSGISMDQEASWCGLGWNISPGSVNRNMRGVPDDFNGEDQIEKTTYVRPNWTAGANVGLNPEIFGKDLKDILGVSGGIFYNNYRGIGIDAGIDITLQAGKNSKSGLTAGLGLGLNNNSQSGLSIEPSFEIMKRNKDAAASGWQSTGFSISPSFSTRSGLQSLTVSAKGTQKYTDEIKNAEGKVIGSRSGTAGNSTGGTISFAHQAYTPTVTNSFTSLQFNFTVKLGGAAVGFHPLGSISGYFSTQYIAKEDQTYSVPAYGYLHYSKSKGVANALMDFNREKELPYRESPSTPHLAIPSYTYDIYSINGEGTGGMFRPYRGDIGYVRDHEMASKSISAGGAIDLGGLPNAWHGGFDIRGSYAATTGRAWTLDNELQRQIQFKDADSTFEPVYFRNPGEKTINTQAFYDKIGDTDPILPVMTAYDDPTLTPFMQRYKGLQPTGTPIKFDAASTYKNDRDKRSQVISYLTANEADSFGLEKKIVAIPENKYFIGKCDSIQCDQFGCVQIVKEKRNTGIRKGHHISEVNVLNADGRKYVYGLPVYNIEQQEVSFAANKANSDVNTGLVGYTPGSENSTDNKEGKDRYFSKEKVPAYAHSFLLTGIVSSDYVDRLEDGITDDDQGDAIKFNYTRVFDAANPFQWRTPFEENKATYNEGLKTDYKDDKGSYIYGKKEIWYLNAVESKAMVATFEINDPAKGDIRKDAYAVKGENGGKDLTKSLRYLKRINLYTKADYIKNGVNALPIKTVNFEYTYELCKGYPAAADANTGKLTLKKIWFTYNKNNKNKQNPYLFYYHPPDLRNGDTTLLAAYNPGYDNKGYDRWGNYKLASQNPAGMTNADYPYAIQDSAIAANNARAWTLSDIQLPSGGRLNVEYESDDYAYVQNKRAAQLYQLAGIGDNADLSQAGSNLYSSLGGDYRYVFIKVSGTVASKQEIYKKFLAGVNKLYFRMQVKMPKDIYGEGFENVTTYAQYEDYGTTTDNTIFWIRLKGTHLHKAGGGDRSPLAKTAIQALKLNLPSKAYPGSDLDGSESLSPEGLIKMMVGFTMNFSSLFVNFATQTRLLGRAKEIRLQNSFVRLNNVNYKKYGGGIRVKRVTVYDSWDKMTGQKEAKYGQEYDYTTLKEIDGKISRISSGVASFEPTIGNDENPFREPIEYDEQIAPLAPSNNMYSEYPLGESFFPSASVGYSKVRIHTINAKNIKSATGYQEAEFYTTYDFPTITDRTELTERKFKSGFLESLFRINALRYLAQTQGFKVETNDMNGREKGMASYPETDPYNAISYTKYFYKVDNEDAEFKHLNNTVMTVDSASGKINSNAQVGKDIEVMVDLRENFSETIGGNLEFNVDGFVLGFIPVGIPMVWAYPQYEANRYRSAATLKVVQRYGILDKVMHYEKGSLITTENVLYDGETGDVVLTKTQNEFNDPVYNFSYPAHWAYTGMGPAYQNIGATFKGIRITDGKIVTAGIYKNIERFFESGDEVIVRGVNRKVSELENKDECTGENLACRTDVFNNIAFTEKLWAINAAKIQNRKNKTGIHFIDKEGKFFTANTAALSLTILRSGKRNMPATPVSAITSLNNPLQNIGGVYKLIFNDSTRVINTSAASFKDFWKVEDVKYQKDTILITKTKVSNEVTIFPVNNYLLHQYRLRFRRPLGICDSDPQGFETTLNPPFIEAQRQNPSSCDDEHNARSIIGFDLSAIPARATISSAFIYLPPHDSVHIRGNGDFNHATLEPHRYDNFNGGSNEFQLARITDNWYTSPTNLTADPNKAYNFDPAQDNTTAVVLPANIKPNISYYKEVTAMMQAMSNNRSQPAQIGMKMTTGGDGNRNRVCIQAKQGILNEGNIDGLSIKIKYHTCAGGQTLTKVCDDYYCYKYDTTKICLSYLQDTSVNPYRWGILGNWRTDRAYTYYEKRRESDPDQETNIRKDGVLAKFVPYWNFSTTTLTATVDTFRWVWNSEMTLFNRKGFEIENRDPLGRHNALLYGYNQTLPVTVAQNSKYREQAYEGFEDFGYQNDKCGKPCTVPRHLDISLTDTRITNIQAHTGRYSLGVTNSDSLLISIPVSDSLTDQKLADLTIRIDTSVIRNTTVTPRGLGMNANYYSLTATDYLNTQVFKNNNFVFPGTPALLTTEDINFDYPAGTPNPKAGARSQYYGVKWNGLIQAAFTGEYQFRLATNNGGYLKIGTTPFDQVLADFPNDPSHVARYSQVMRIKLRAGVLYSIEAGMEQGNDAVDPGGNTGHRAVLEWAVPGSSVFNVVGKGYYYKTLADTLGSVARANTNCIKMQDIRPSKNIIYNGFSPLQKTRLVVSAWLKEEKDCKCETYENSLVRVAFFDVNNNLLRDSLFKPTGNIIDGWQRLEEYFTLPAGAVTMKLSVRAGTLNSYAGKVFVDDIRVHPFLSNMKSYVYDPVSLRLMSELDENNYATFYEYDDDGTLIRVKKETERGIKTINETRSALVKTPVP